MTKPSLVGTWALLRGTCTAADGTPRPEPYGPKGMGRVSFSPDGYMVAVVCDCRADLPDDVEREYNSYCGTYTFDGKRLVTKVFANSDPRRLSVDQIRDIHFEGKLLVMRPPPSADRGHIGDQRVVWWEKIAEV
jgi:hypothetical protein